MKFSEGEGRRAVSLWAQFIIVITGGMRLSGGWTRLNNGVSQSVIWRERIRGRILVNTLAPVERIVCRVHVEFFFFFLFFSFFLLPCFSSLSLFLVPRLSPRFISNFQRRRLEEKKRTCTNNPDLSFLVSFFFFPPFFPLSLSVPLLSRLSVYCEFQVDKGFFSPSLLSRGEFLVGIEADCYW